MNVESACEAYHITVAADAATSVDAADAHMSNFCANTILTLKSFISHEW